MKTGLMVILLFSFAACKTSTASKIPNISLTNFGPDSVKVNLDTAYIVFHFTDGDADLGNDPNSTNYDIYIKDSRFDTQGFVGYRFPTIDGSVQNPDRGIEGTCIFELIPLYITIRPDSLHMAAGDTAHYELYIKDRAQHESNHITTPNLYIRP